MKEKETSHQFVATRLLVEQLRREVPINRQNVSASINELIKYCKVNSGHDPLLNASICDKKFNPFNDEVPTCCRIL